MTKEAAQKETNGKEFWVEIGMKLGRVQAVEDKLDKFMTNDHVHLCAEVKALDEKMDGMALRIAKAVGMVVGALTVISIAIQVVLKLTLK